MNSITILGSGRVGTALATALSLAGRQVVVGTREPDRLRASWAGPAIEVTDVRDAIDRSDVVINATPGDTSVERLTARADELSGKTLIDVSNATTRGDDGMPGGLVYEGSSVGELLQAALPRTAVVKTLNTMLFSAMASPGTLASAPTVFLSGDDSEAKDRARDILSALGWDERWMMDLGGIQTARGTEAFALLVPSLLGTLGFAPFALSIAR
jgi:predicted dinucleotide-binding enzyme